MSGNTILHTDITGILVSDADLAAVGGGASDVTVTGNSVQSIDDNTPYTCGAPYGTVVDFRHTTAGCLDMADNRSAESPASCSPKTHFLVRQRDTSVVRFEELSNGTGGRAT